MGGWAEAQLRPVLEHWTWDSYSYVGNTDRMSVDIILCLNRNQIYFYMLCFTELT